MAKGTFQRLFVIVVILAAITGGLHGATDQQDVTALQGIYTNLGSPQQLNGWSANGADPCGQSWKGVSCSGSSVTSINLSGLGLTGILYYQLSSLSSLTTLDLSNNNIHGSIPYSLPPKLQNLNLANNNLDGNIPYSFSNMTALNSVDLSHNHLSGQIVDAFQQLSSLSTLDLSFNNLSDNLPQSFSALSNLNSLQLQNNQLTGPVNVLANLQLGDLNIENNHFSGWIPNQWKSKQNFQYGGNNFSAGSAPPLHHTLHPLGGNQTGRPPKVHLIRQAMKAAIRNLQVLGKLWV